MLQHSIENRSQLMPTRRQSDFFACPHREQPLIKGVDLRLKTGRHARAPIQPGAHRRATSPHGAPAAQGPTVAIEGRHTNQGRDVLPCERPQCGECQQQRPGTHRPNAEDTVPQVGIFAPQRAGTKHRLQVVIQRGDACLEPGNMRLNVLWQALTRPREAVRYGLEESRT